MILDEKVGFGMHRVFPVENLEFCCDRLRKLTVEKGDFVFLYRYMKEDSDWTIRWHVKCPFCQAGLIISQYSMKLEGIEDKGT